MDTKTMPQILKDQYEFYTHLWHKKQCGVNLDWHSFNLSDNFERIVEIDEIDRSELYANGRVIFRDKDRGMRFEIGVSGELEKLQAGLDIPFEQDARQIGQEDFQKEAPGNKPTDFVLFLNGNVYYENVDKIMTGTFSHGIARGYFYTHEKSNDVTDVLNLQFGDISQTRRETYNERGIRDGIERYENYEFGHGLCQVYKNGKKVGQTNHYRCEESREKNVLQKLMCMTATFREKQRLNDLNEIAMAMIVKDRAGYER